MRLYKLYIFVRDISQNEDVHLNRDFAGYGNAVTEKLYICDIFMTHIATIIQ